MGLSQIFLQIFLMRRFGIQLINIGISFTVMFENDQPRTDVAHFINESLGKIKINDKEDYLMIERKNK